MTAHKIVMLVLDGIGDRPCGELAGMTPLQAAKTPILDQLAAEGITGIMDTIGPGIRPGSDTSHLSLLGYPPESYYTGRGPLEAEGCGIHMEHGMIGFRANFATQNDHGLVTDRRAGRIHDTRLLSAAITDQVDLSAFGVTFSFASGAGHRAALALSGEGLGAGVTSNDPKEDGVAPHQVMPVSANPEDQKTAAVCNEFIRQSTAILADHPMNRARVLNGESPASVVLIRGAGEMGGFEPFQQRYDLSGAVIAAATLVTGIGKAVGLEYIPVEGVTGSTTTNLTGKVQTLMATLDTHDFVLLNIKGADEAGHDGHAIEKRDFIERIDAALALLLERNDCIIAVMGDHSTPCPIKEHSADPVPVLIRGDGVRVDLVQAYDEIACAAGGLNRIRGADILWILLDLIDKTHKYGT
ncbi:2,3-bisphosphoglycerate-independent phosphoglycerate mutase [Methanosphaerula palustris]|uniref:2,3-bisphosphoglycerate-independent phosphoglycerate mutase n=1 Tax=Methanosphaerula palustris (strain ATCC BAA-1556 / DSM 19958 / E1-9c) TaxID=521011 RepID=APGM_METPE|nr:2,3-bisphosphoglycerate-independent phosphoglycerate mutase [Methanosphaerula palustris]B8GFN7.1 RecName: Full=2,3-bisphosphoglycerate-independent phosphoglycerate mutase; Short=BPG-independent PGAM; Short=Phosphoglyceromutase; Short=aPGAM [Methanosphaerula palustris E1-9c]ACL17920.1 phosphonopyruvate decarboxylase-related protein [Methanosphaerula palustris E1-9c]